MAPPAWARRPLLTLPRSRPRRAGEPKCPENCCHRSSSGSHQRSFGGRASGIPRAVARIPAALQAGSGPSSPTLSLMPTAAGRGRTPQHCFQVPGVSPGPGGLRRALRRGLVQGLLLYPDRSGGGLRPPLLTAQHVLAELGGVHATPTGCSHTETPLEQPLQHLPGKKEGSAMPRCKRVCLAWPCGQVGISQGKPILLFRPQDRHRPAEPPAEQPREGREQPDPGSP